MTNELSIVIPILNEAKNILILVPEINKARIKLKIEKFEVLLIDDDSTDNIKYVVKKLKKKFKYLKIFTRKNKKKDLSKSCFLGFEKSSFNNILVMDGDNQHPPRYIVKLFKAYTKGRFDIVVGSRNLLSKRNIGLSYIIMLESLIISTLSKIKRCNGHVLNINQQLLENPWKYNLKYSKIISVLIICFVYNFLSIYTLQVSTSISMQQ